MTAMTNPNPARSLFGLLPEGMSLMALALVAEAAIEFGDVRQPDEGWQAHLFQLLMVAQLPLIGLFALRYRKSLGEAAPVLGLQLLLLGAALALVAFLGL
jgi:hypothetical protein